MDSLEKYRRQRIERELYDALTFRHQGRFPRKCQACYDMGLRSCKWWSRNFNCSEHTIGEIEKLIEKYV